MTRKKQDSLMIELKAAVKKVLDNPKSKPGEVLKAIEAGAKLLMIESKIDGTAPGSSYFD